MSRRLRSEGTPINSEICVVGLPLSGAAGREPDCWDVRVRVVSRKSRGTYAVPQVLVSQTYRLPVDLAEELTRVVVYRKLDRTAPWSEQDIRCRGNTRLTRKACKHESDLVAHVLKCGSPSLELTFVIVS